MRHHDTDSLRPGTDRHRPTASVRHTWWGVTTPRRTHTPTRRPWVGLLAVATLAVAFPVWLWFLTEALVAAGLLVGAPAALTVWRLGVSPDDPPVADAPGPLVVGPTDT